MADDTAPKNGNLRHYAVIFVGAGLCIALTFHGGIALALLFHPPGDLAWNAVQSLVDGIKTAETVLGAGLLGIAKPTSS